VNEKVDDDDATGSKSADDNVVGMRGAGDGQRHRREPAA
jgi:hypothetical protein